ncbi:alpha/beta fold hydrolase [Candidatus Bathyarchaeota archaeon]|nr:alpha/beta fold hydrolase [Candidatus Bathyarchaeota archaeon]
MGSNVKTETVWVDCGSAKLYGKLYIPNAVPSSGLLICHGLNAKGFHLLKIYTLLTRVACREGFVTLVFDFRGAGKSGGQFDYGFGEQEDVKCALRFLTSRPEVMPNSIFVVGHSLGGAVSLYALQNETRVKGLVLWSTPKNHNYNVKKFIKNTRGKLGLYAFLVLSYLDKILNVSRLFKLEVCGVNLRPKDVREKLMKLNECEAVSKLSKMPLLVVVGGSDEIVGVDEAKEIYNSAHEPKILLIIDSADHVYTGKEDELIAKTIEWIKKWMT